MTVKSKKERQQKVNVLESKIKLLEENNNKSLKIIV